MLAGPTPASCSVSLPLHGCKVALAVCGPQAADYTAVQTPASCSVSLPLHGCRVVPAVLWSASCRLKPTHPPAELLVTLSYCLHVRLLASRMRACCRGGRGPRHWVSKYGLTRPAPYALQFIALGYYYYSCATPCRSLIDAVCAAAFDARWIASPLASHWPAGLQVLLVSRCLCLQL